MLSKAIFPSIALGASVADYLGAGKPVAIIDEYEVRGNQLEAFLDLHHSVYTQGYQKSSSFIKKEDIVDFSCDLRSTKMCSVTFMSFWENENAAKQIRSDAEFDTVFKNGIEKLEINHNYIGVYPNSDIYSIIGLPSENGSPERPEEISTDQAFEKTAWSISAYPYRIPGNQMQAYLDLEAKHWGPQNAKFAFYQRNSEFVSTSCDLSSDVECNYLNVNYWSNHEEYKLINATETAEVDEAFQKEGEFLGIKFEFVGPFPGSATAGLANMNGRKAVDPLGGNACLIFGSLSLLFYTLLL
ncbi:unnamed protein product [Oikopleura dioica]|uniref:Uncharacterized protein n=1 Tax=Oikopleura dioica TaxID=34765 RepID=E4XBC9_OIKDI|nr:unnamed protein product [Oikopleura dioica]